MNMRQKTSQTNWGYCVPIFLVAMSISGWMATIASRERTLAHVARQSDRPLGKDLIKNALKEINPRLASGLESLAKAIDERGVDFELTPAIKQEFLEARREALRKNNLRIPTSDKSFDDLMTLIAAKRPKPTPTPTPTPTPIPAILSGPAFSKEALLGELGKVKADLLVEAIKARGVGFKLTLEEQVRFYESGADKALVDAIKQNYHAPIISTKNPYLNAEFIVLPEGEFQMGAEKWEEDEVPVHAVRIGAGYEIGKHEVTQAQWTLVMENNPSRVNAPNNPVENVSWEEVQVFIKRLNNRNDGYLYRLPTEAEWEYACRGGTNSDYAGVLDDLAWHAGNSGDKAHPVGEKKPNRWGLYDMHGNVREWVQDLYATYQPGIATDPRGPESGTDRVLRGGGWKDKGDLSRSSNRSSRSTAIREDNIGFRLARVKRPPSLPAENTQLAANNPGTSTPAATSTPVPPKPAPTPRPAATQSETLVLSKSALLAKAIKQVAPLYPSVAKSNGIRGQVEVAVEVDERGQVIKAVVVSGPTLLRVASEQAAKQWKFSQTLSAEGKPIKVSGVITFNFAP